MALRKDLNLPISSSLSSPSSEIVVATFSGASLGSLSTNWLDFYTAESWSHSCDLKQLPCIGAWSSCLCCLLTSYSMCSKDSVLLLPRLITGAYINWPGRCRCWSFSVGLFLHGNPFVFFTAYHGENFIQWWKFIFSRIWILTWSYQD